MIGPNASGKSNALEGIQFLYWLARGRRLAEVLRSVQENDVQIRGTVYDLAYDHTDRFSLGCSFELSLDDPSLDEWKHLDLTIEIADGRMRVVEEEVSGKGTSRYPLYRVEQPADRYGNELQIGYNNFSPSGKKPRITCTDQQAVFTQLTTPSRFNGKSAQKVIPSVAQLFEITLDKTLFLDPNPRAMRGYSVINDTRLRGDGSNLSSVLYGLVQQGWGDELLGFIRSLPEQEFADIDFIETPRFEVMVSLIETFRQRNRSRDASVLSDGTLRVLAVAAALLSAPEGSLVVIEEIDNGVHPSRARMLLENMQQTAKARNLRVLLTSHNPALLDNLPDEAVPDVVCCYRDPEEGDSRIVRFADIPDYPSLVAQGPIGRLMASDVLDRFLKQPRTSEERKRVAKRFFERMEAEQAG